MSINYVENRAIYARLLAGDGTAITDTVAGRLDVQCTGAVTATNAAANNFLCNANLQLGDADADSSCNAVMSSSTLRKRSRVVSCQLCRLRLLPIAQTMNAASAIPTGGRKTAEVRPMQ